jgi:hypothetical protein
MVFFKFKLWMLGGTYQSENDYIRIIRSDCMQLFHICIVPWYSQLLINYVVFHLKCLF